ncbi:Co2+/Mg2+ efflux protein ApaG [Neisseria sp.]|uniref:Co2+/Mg2+ efflux protein ApaG n=1 Tax=Neisseria sp. TaxID=192066 RepID=UPI0035A03586
MNEIEISVQPKYMAGSSDVYRDRYAFNYSITICNRSSDIITLRQRVWEITDGHGGTEHLSAGSSSEQPVLYPGEAYEYHSGSQLSTPWGSIEGAYEFEDSIGKRFIVDVPKLDFKAGFTLQ